MNHVVKRDSEVSNHPFKGKSLGSPGFRRTFIGIAVALVATACAAQVEYGDAPTVSVDGIEPATAWTWPTSGSAWTVEAKNTGFTNGSTVSGQVQTSGTTPATQKGGGCLLMRATTSTGASITCTTESEGPDSGVAPTNPPGRTMPLDPACPGPPSWAAGGYSYCLEPQGGGNTKYCYWRPGTAANYCTGTPALGGVAQAPKTWDASAAAYPYSNGQRPSAANTWMMFGCIDGCNFNADAGNIGSKSQEFSTSAQQRDLRSPSSTSRDGLPDLLGYDVTSGQLKVHPGNTDAGFEATGAEATAVDGGVAADSTYVYPGDLTGDGRADVVEWNATTHDMRVWAGNSSGQFTTPAVTVGNYPSLTSIFAVGDWDGDGNNDIMVSVTQFNYEFWQNTEHLYLFRGSPQSSIRFETLTPILNEMWDASFYFGGADWNGDGKPDLYKKTSDGNLYFCPGTRLMNYEFIGACVYKSGGWNSMGWIFSGGQRNGSGGPEVMAVDSSTGVLWQYPGDGAGGFGTRTSLGTSWSPLFGNFYPHAVLY